MCSRRARGGGCAPAFPSTSWTLIERGDVLEGARALGLVLLPRARSTPLLLLAGAPVHLALSVGWAGVLGAVLPPRAEPVSGSPAGSRSRRLTSRCSGGCSRRSPRYRKAASGPTMRLSGSAWELCCKPLGERAVGVLRVLRPDDRAGGDELLGDAHVVTARDVVRWEPCATQSSVGTWAPAAQQLARQLGIADPRDVLQQRALG